MNQRVKEYPGFLSRMSDLELRLKQSEDERLALEDKFNKLLNNRKSEEEMHLYLLRSNYGQLLRQDKLRCDRNDMILQSLANVESRASMLTAKTDRLRLLRQHYESCVNRHFPVLRKAVGRYRSVESLNSDTNENLAQRSLSSSPRRLYSHSPSPFVRSPSISRRNSLVVSNSEIMSHPNYKVPDLSPHFSRRRLFEDTLKLEKGFKSPRERTLSPPKSFMSLQNDERENLSMNVPTFIVSTPTNQIKVGQRPDLEELAGNSLFNAPSYIDYTGSSVLENSKIFSKQNSENNTHRTSPLLRGSNTGQVSPVGSSSRALTLKRFPSKPLTKSSSFSYSSNASNYIVPEKRQPSFSWRPSLFCQTDISHKPLIRAQSTPMRNNFLPQNTYENIKSSFNENLPHKKRPSISRKYSFSEISKPPPSVRPKTSIRERGISPTPVRSKSPLTVVDDIFKKYLINYDKTYLSDPISESKYGKYLYPLNTYNYTYSNYNSVNKLPNEINSHFESKYDVRSPYLYDDVSSIRGNISSNLSKTYGSQDSICTNDIQSNIHERNMSCFDDKKDWKEWNYYRNRYEYPPTLDPERIHTRSVFPDNTYNRSRSESNLSMGVNEPRSYRFLGDQQFEYSYPTNWNRESYDFNPNGIRLENSVKSKDCDPPYERKFSGKYDSTFKENFKNPPQTPKKVSFSNEFLYDDKSDTEVSSNLDDMSVPFDGVTSSEKTAAHNSNSFLLKGDSYQDHGEGLGISKEMRSYYSNDHDKESEKFDIMKPSADKMLEVNGEEPRTKSIENNEDIKSLKEFDTKINEPTNEKNIQSHQDFATEDGIIEEHHKEMPFDMIRNDYLLDNKRSELYGEKEASNITMEETENGTTKLDDVSYGLSPKLDDSSVGSETANFLPSSMNKEDSQSKTSPNNEDCIQPDRQNTHLHDEERPNQSEANQNQLKETGSFENSENRNAADLDTIGDIPTRNDIGFSEEHQIVYDQVPQEHKDLYDSHTTQPYQGQNAVMNSDTTKYPIDYNTEPNEQPKNQYEQKTEGYLSEDYIQKDGQIFDHNKDGHGTENNQQQKVHVDNRYEQQHLEYQAKGFRGSQQSIQDYSQPLPQQKYEGERYISPATSQGHLYEQQYKDGEQHYLPEDRPDNYVAEQQQEGEYSSEYPQQQYDPGYQDPSQVSQNVPGQYEADYNTTYQDESQYEYNKEGATYDEPQYDQHQQPPYDQYDQQPTEAAYDQYQQQPVEGQYDQYQQQPVEEQYDQYQQQPVEEQYDQYQQKVEPPYDQYQQQADAYDQYDQQPAKVPYDQYEQQHTEVPYDQYEQQPGDVPYDQYQQQPADEPYDQYEQQTAKIPYDQYEQQPTEATYDQYEQQPAKVPYDQYEQQPAEVTYDQYEQQPAKVPYDQYQQEPTDPAYGNYDQQPSDPSYDKFKQQPSEHYDDHYQGAPNQYQNYDYPYDQTAPVAEKQQAYIGEQTQQYIEETQPVDYTNEPLQQPYGDVVQQQPYDKNLPYEENQQVYPDRQQVYETEYLPKTDVSQHLTQPDKPDVVAATPHTQLEISSRETSKPAPLTSQVLESDSESPVLQKPTT